MTAAHDGPLPGSLRSQARRELRGGDAKSEPEAITDGQAITELGDALRVFFSRPGPKTIARYAGTAWCVRALLGPPGVRDALACAGVVAWWPFQEWLAHRYLLHLKPTRRFDPLFARRHRAHHVEPRDIDLTLLPLEVLRTAMPANVAAWLLLAGRNRSAVTGIAAFATAALWYEWTHFIVHTGYRPKAEFFRTVRKNHRMHHYRNERYWLGFTVPLVDTVLGTNPEASAVKVSKTAQDLHGLRGAGWE